MNDFRNQESSAQSADSRIDHPLQWNDPDDSANPFNWKVKTKWNVTLTACHVTLIVGLNATAMRSASEVINEQFGVSDRHFANSYWPVVSWTVGAAVAPMMILPILEDFGMRIGYITVYAIFIIFMIPQAVAPNFATLIVCRFISGCCGGFLQDIMDGIIADVWPDAVQRSLPVPCYVFCLLVGVTLGPVMGGAVVGSLNWRWIFHIQLIAYGASLLLVLMFIRETGGPVILLKRGKKKQKNPTYKPIELLTKPSLSDRRFKEVRSVQKVTPVLQRTVWRRRQLDLKFGRLNLVNT